MVATWVDFHVSSRGHVTFNTLGTLRALVVAMVRGRVVFSSSMLMTGGTDLISCVLESGGMRVVTVRAANALAVHLALHKRTMHIDLVLNLPVRVIQQRRQERILVVIVKVVARNKAWMHAPLASRMASSAHVDLWPSIIALKPCESITPLAIPE